MKIAFDIDGVICSEYSAIFSKLTNMVMSIQKRAS